MRKIICLLAVFTAAFSVVFGQVQVEWVQRYEISDYNILPYASGHALLVDRSGNVHICGTLDSDTTSGNNYDFLTIKYSSSGIQQWVRTYDSPIHGSDIEKTACLDEAGNIYIGGTSDGGVIAQNDFCIVKYSPAGVQQWVFRYDTPEHGIENLCKISVDGTSGIYAVGTTKIGTNNGVLLLKISPAGILLSQTRVILYFPAQTYDITLNVTTDILNNIIILFKYVDFETSIFGIRKYNSNGDSLWKCQYSWAGGIGLSGLSVDNLNNVYFGYMSTNPYFMNVIYIKKLNSSGATVGTATYNTGSQGIPLGFGPFVVDNTGNIYFTGSVAINYPVWKMITIKFNASLNPQWVRYYSGINGNNNSSGNALVIDRIGNLYVTGNTYVTEYASNYITIKYSNAGDSLWTVRYIPLSSGINKPSVINLDTSGNIYVSGTSQNSNQSYSYATIKYHQLAAIRTISAGIPDNFSLSQNYPNPFNPVTKIRFSLPLPSKGGAMDVRLVVFDVLGREIANLIPPLRGGQEGLLPGTYEVEWDPEKSGQAGLSSGIYFYKLTTNDYSETKKMVLIK